MDQNDLKTIRELTLTMHDSALGYAAASRRAMDPELKEYLMEASVARAGEALQLVGELRRNAVPVPVGGTVLGAAHRTWMAFRDQLFGMDDAGMLAECGRGDSHLIGRYDDALGHLQSSVELRESLQQQREAVMSSYHSIQSMEVPLA
jgi:uncharacterized protein (TIGR02284 family)